jgi:hypothetical protein
VNEKKDFYIAVVFSIAVVLIFTVVPYLMAARMAAPHGEFGGFLINPIDGFSYLAKMRQGYEGSWLLELPYAAEPGQGTLIFAYHMFLGHVARLFGAPLLTVYHTARALTAIAMFLIAFIFFQHLLPNRRTTWAAFLITLFASGLGWLAEPLGVLSIDLWVPEAIPLLTAYANAHFALATCALIGAALVIILPQMRRVWRLLSTLACGFVLGAVFPFGVGTLLAVFGAWLLWELMRKSIPERRAWLQSQRDRLLALLVLLVAALPWLVYDLWVSRSHPALSVWTAQNQTPSPPLVNTILGFGLVIALAIAGMRKAHRSEIGRLLISWVAVNFMLLYVPFSLQRRLTLGIFFPMAALAALDLSALAGRRISMRMLLPLLLLVMIPTNLLVIAAGVWGTGQADPTMLIWSDEAAGFHWLEENAPADALVLAGADNGNRLPAYADVRVLYGHPFETPHAEIELQNIATLYSWRASPEEGIEMLQSRGVDFVFFGPREREVGEPTWIEELTIVFSEGEVAIYLVSAP